MIKLTGIPNLLQWPTMKMSHIDTLREQATELLTKERAATDPEEKAKHRAQYEALYTLVGRCLTKYHEYLDDAAKLAMELAK